MRGRLPSRGKDCGHLLDPRSGWPTEGPVSVSVIGESRLTAGAVSTVACLHEGSDKRNRMARRGNLPWLMVNRLGGTSGPIVGDLTQATQGRYSAHDFGGKHVESACGMMLYTGRSSDLIYIIMATQAPATQRQSRILVLSWIRQFFASLFWTLVTSRLSRTPPRTCPTKHKYYKFPQSPTRARMSVQMRIELSLG